MSNNGIKEVVSSTYSIKNKDTVFGLTQLVNNSKASGDLLGLARRQIRVPLKTRGGRVLYLPLVQLSQNPSGGRYISNTKSNLVLPIYYLNFKKDVYKPATLDEVIEDQKRILAMNYNESKLQGFLDTLTFVSEYVA